jgi:hypothetical protein
LQIDGDVVAGTPELAHGTRESHVPWRGRNRGIVSAVLVAVRAASIDHEPAIENWNEIEDLAVPRTHEPVDPGRRVRLPQRGRHRYRMDDVTERAKADDEHAVHELVEPFLPFQPFQPLLPFSPFIPVA